MAGKSEIVDVDVVLIHETLKAWKVATAAMQDEDKFIWISKDMAELEREGAGTQVWILTLPRWKAEKDGLI